MSKLKYELNERDIPKIKQVMMPNRVPFSQTGFIFPDGSTWYFYIAHFDVSRIIMNEIKECNVDDPTWPLLKLGIIRIGYEWGTYYAYGIQKPTSKAEKAIIDAMLEHHTDNESIKTISVDFDLDPLF